MPPFVGSDQHRGSESSAVGLVEHEKSRKNHDTLSPITSQADGSNSDEKCMIDIEDDTISQPPEYSPSSAEPPPPNRILVSWEDGDPENPYNWSHKEKAFVVIIGSIVVINSTMGSSLPANAIPFISETFNITSTYAQILPISMYLIGYIVGPCVFGPLSESYGRRYLMTTSFVAFILCTMACALSPNWTAFLLFRLLTGISASSPIAVIGGIFADIYDDPVARGRAMAAFIGGTCFGPLIAPLISGFISPALGWRWAFWIALIFAGITLPPLLLLPETYGPVLLARRAARLRKETGNHNIFAPFELGKKGFKQMATVTLMRPLRMIFCELLVLATCLYLSLAYGIFYMYFEAYPLIFQGIYGQSPGVSGLMFLPIGCGIIGAIVLFLYYDSTLRKAQALNKPWTQREESRRLPLACIGGPLYVVSLFWLGWTSQPQIPFYVPMLAGIPFGMGFVLIFMALLNYLTDAYEIYAASAMAAASCSRSVAGAVLPFAADPMYKHLGVSWATSLLAFLSLGMCVIPFAFLWKGDVIRERSEFCRFLKERKEKEARDLDEKRRSEGGEKVQVGV